MEDSYLCEKCGDEWWFFEDDFEFMEDEYPTICPHCHMPITQMFVDIYREEGFYEALKRSIMRILSIKSNIQ